MSVREARVSRSWLCGLRRTEWTIVISRKRVRRIEGRCEWETRERDERSVEVKFESLNISVINSGGKVGSREEEEGVEEEGVSEPFEAWFLRV